MVFPNERHEQYGYDEGKQAELKALREDCLFKMKSAGLCLKTYMSADGDELVVEMGIPQRYLEFIATQLQLPITAELTVKETDEETGKETNRTFEAFRPFDMMKLPHADRTLIDVSSGPSSWWRRWVAPGCVGLRWVGLGLGRR